MKNYVDYKQIKKNRKALLKMNFQIAMVFTVISGGLFWINFSGWGTVAVIFAGLFWMFILGILVDG